MSYIIRVRPDAERDTERIYLWYEEQSSGLGAECVAELDAVYDRLAETPRIYADIFHGMRRGLLRRFPVGVFYVVDEGEVRVLAVTQLSRNPDVWQSRR